MSNRFEDPDERALSRALHEEADTVAETPASLDAVRARAGSVRRRRRLVAGAGIAAAAVILVPIAIVASNGLGDPDPTLTVSATPTASPTVDRTPSPATPSATANPKVPSSPLPFDVSDLPTGAPPAIDWSDGRDIHRGDGRVATGVLPQGSLELAPMGSGWIVVAIDPEATAQLSARWISATGDASSRSYEIGGGLATSPDGAVVAWVESDGTVRVVQDGGDEVLTLPKVAAPGNYRAIAVTGEDCQETDTNPGCTVLANAGTLPDGQTWLSTSHGFVERYDEGIKLLTAWTDGAYAGIVEFDESRPGTCSAVRDPNTLSSLWETCDHRLVGFSPDGQRLIGADAYGDGFGDTQVALIDATDGTVLTEVMSDEAHQTTSLQTAWEDDDHVLVVTYADGEWAVVRLGVDGSMEYAVPPRAGSDLERPFLLQS